MAKNNSSNQDYTNNADGWDLSGGTTKRKLTITGADITLTGSGTNVYTMPAATDTLVGRASTDTLTNKTITSTTNTVSAATFTNPYKFSAHQVGAASSGNGAFAILKFDTKYYDTGTNYSTTTGLFTAPVAGFYHFNTVVGSNTAVTLAVSIFKNGTEFQRLQEGVISGGVYWFFVGAVDMQLATNDTVGIYVYGSSTATISVASGSDAVFSGHLISIT